jgi:hypothetical protein
MTRRNKETLKEDYLSWLEPQLRDEHGNPDKNYWELLHLMFEKEFGWVDTVPKDENRVVDGRDLRLYFTREYNLRPSALDFLGPGSSFLEVLIALSRHMSFVAGGSAPGWAWHLLSNLELDRMWDPLTGAKRNKVEEILNRVIERTYSPSGQGGFFPLSRPEEDMTRIELWYQMNIYVSELYSER